MSQSFTAKTAIQCASLSTPESLHRQRKGRPHQNRVISQFVKFSFSKDILSLLPLRGLTSRSLRSSMLGHPFLQQPAPVFDDARLQWGEGGSNQLWSGVLHHQIVSKLT